MDELVQHYIKVRDRRSQLKAEYEQRDQQYRDLMDTIEAAMLSRFNEMGVDSVKTPAGTAYVAVTARASIGDWDSFREFLDRQDNPFDFVERRVAKAAVEAYKAANDDLPPGINWSETRSVNFRRS